MIRFKFFFSCLFLVVFLLICLSDIFAAEETREDCCVCGMWIDQYMHTRHVLTEAGGSRLSFCSFTCAAKYIKKHGSDVNQLQASDYITAELVYAKDAFYLVGSDAPPVMSYTSIIVFADLEKANDYQKSNGGKIMTFTKVFANY